jgi:hypothetical protein
MNAPNCVGMLVRLYQNAEYSRDRNNHQPICASDVSSDLEKLSQMTYTECLEKLRLCVGAPSRRRFVGMVHRLVHMEPL